MLKSSVLIVEDDAQTLRACRETLTSLDLDMAIAGSGRDALNRVLEKDFAVILLNVRMPDSDGFATGRRIRDCERSRHTPIIFLTGAHDETVTSIRGAEAGGVDYLVKPLQPDILRSKIAVFVDLHRNNAELGRKISERALVEQDLRNSEAKLRAFAAHIQSVREEERKTIAREIHDELGQALTGLRMDLSWLEKRLPRELKEPAEKMKSMFRLIDDTIQSVRRISSALRPRVLDEVGLPGALKWQAREFRSRTGIRCRIDLPDGEFAMGQDQCTAVFRIFQEAMTNVARHANATRVDIKLRLDADHLILSVVDNGLGISAADSRSSKALGLLGIRERALLLGGEVEIEGKPGGGTRVTLSVPLQLQGKQ